MQPQSLKRIARRLRRRATDLSASDHVWADELTRCKLLSPYQAATLLRAADPLSEGGYQSPTRDRPLKIGTHVIIDRIAQSDLGATYRSRSLANRECQAVKIIDPQWSEPAPQRIELLQAAERWNQLSDARVVTVSPLDAEERGIALESRWITGRPLSESLRGGRRLPSTMALEVVYELLAILTAADAFALVHGDLKPSNIMLDQRGQVRLVDGGIRAALRAAALRVDRNLPPRYYDYVAPEIASGHHTPNTASEIYAIGCLLYHLVTGRPPFSGGTAQRKYENHQAGRLLDPYDLAANIRPDVKRILSLSIQADPSKRAEAYGDLLRKPLPARLKHRRRPLRQLDRPIGWLGTSIAMEPPETVRWSKWLVWAAAMAATGFVTVQGSARLLPLLSLRPALRSTSIITDTQEPPTGSNQTTAHSVVTGLWNATEDLQRAYHEASPHDTITLQSPGPFLVDAIEIDKPITLRGADGVRPMIVGGPLSVLRIAAVAVALENLHFVRCGERRAGETDTAPALVHASSAQLSIKRCSFQDLNGTDEVRAIQWTPAGPAPDVPPTLSLSDVLIHNFGGAVSVAAQGGSQIAFENCLYLGSGPMIYSRSSRARAFETMDVALTNVTVHGSTTIEHAFPHPLDSAAPLRITARECYLLARDRNQPMLLVRYITRPSLLMPKVSWSGAGTVCPADATTLEVTYGADAMPWRASDVAAWQKYWGTHATGLIGARVEFARSVPTQLSELPDPRRASRSPLGVDISRLVYPLPVAMDQLPVLVERLQLQ